jgi:hypothetical protein
MRFGILSVVLALALAGGVLAQTWGPGILIDGSMDEWDGQVPTLVTDPSGDGGTGRDVQAVYLCNDQNNLYVRIQSFNADGFDGNELSGIDGDNSAVTGFNLFGGGLGSDTLVAGASVYGETTTVYNNGAATPGSVAWGPFVATTDIEYAVDLTTAVPGDILQSFPGGLGSTINFIFGDSNGGAGDVSGPATYTLATGSGAVTPAPIIDEMVLYDTNPNAAARTVDSSTAAGFSIVANNRVGGGPAGPADTALEVIHTNAAASAWNISIATHRFASPRNITGHSTVTLDVFGDPVLNPLNQNLFVGLLDTGGTHFAVGAVAPNVPAWTTTDLASTSAWLLQAAGDDGILDLANIIEWRIGIQENGNAVGSISTIGYDNFLGVGAVPVELSIFSTD